MNEREELGLWAYVAIFLAILASLAASYQNLHSPYAGTHPRDLRHPWGDQPEKYMQQAEAETPTTEYTSPTE